MNSRKILISKKYTFYFLFLLFGSFFYLKSFKEINQNDISIAGTEFITKDIILKNSSLDLPQKLIHVKTKFHERELKDNLSLKNISITRQLFPFGLKINLQLRDPIAYAEINHKQNLIKGFIDKEGFFINEEFAFLKKGLPYNFKVIGWKEKSYKEISKIIRAYRKNKDLKSITVSKEGNIILEEKKLKKIFLGNNSKKIDFQLELISEIKNQFSDKEFFRKIENLDLRDINNPTLKVFKP